MKRMMRPGAIWTKLRTLTSRVKGGLVQDCPPELFACEICGKRECTSETWLNCRQRLAAEQFLKSGDPQALAELERLRIARDQAIGCQQAAPDRAGETAPQSAQQGAQVPT